MAAEAIQRIKDAEDKASMKLAEALEEAKKISKAAQKKGSDKRQAILADAKRQREEIMEKARSEAEAESVPLTKESDAEINQIKNPAPKKLDEAVGKVIERIVRLVDR